MPCDSADDDLAQQNARTLAPASSSISSWLRSGGRAGAELGDDVATVDHNPANIPSEQCPEGHRGVDGSARREIAQCDALSIAAYRWFSVQA